MHICEIDRTFSKYWSWLGDLEYKKEWPPKVKQAQYLQVHYPLSVVISDVDMRVREAEVSFIKGH